MPPPLRSMKRVLPRLLPQVQNAFCTQRRFLAPRAPSSSGLSGTLKNPLLLRCNGALCRPYSAIADEEKEKRAEALPSSSSSSTLLGSLKLCAALRKSGVDYREECPDSRVIAHVPEDHLVERLGYLRSIVPTESSLVHLACAHPILLTMDLAEGMRETLACMHSLGFEAAHVTATLVRHPEITSAILGSAFADKVKTVSKLGLSADEIRPAMRKLLKGRASLLGFLKLPQTQLDSAIRFIQSWGRSKPVLRTMLIECPSILLLSEPAMKSILELLQSFSNAPLKLIAKCPRLLHLDTTNLTETLTYWESFGVEKDEIAKYLRGFPETLTIPKSYCQSTAEYLESLGLEKKDVVAILLTRPSLMSNGVDRLKYRVELLCGKGLENMDICALLKNRKSVEAFATKLGTLNHKLGLLEKQGIVNEDLRKLVVSVPSVMTANGISKMEYGSGFVIQQLGLDKNTTEHRLAFKTLLLTTSKRLKKQVDYLSSLGLEQGEAVKSAAALNKSGAKKQVEHLLSLGFNREGVCRMAKRVPAVLSINRQALTKRVQFLLNTMGRSVEEIVDCPSFLFCSMKKKILPRHRVLSWLESSGALGGSPVPLSKIVMTDEEVFVKEFVECHAGASAVYIGDVDAAQTKTLNPSDEQQSAEMT